MNSELQAPNQLERKMTDSADKSRLGVNFKGESTDGARLPPGHRPRNGAAGEQSEGSEGSSSGSGFLGKTSE